LQEHPRSCKASGARPAGPLTRPHGIALATRGEERPISKRQHLRDPSGYTHRCSGATVGDSHKGPLNNWGKPTSSRKKRKRKLIHEPKNANTKAITTLVAPAAHLNTPSGEVRLARGSNAPSGEVRLARGPSRARHPRSYSHVRAFNALTP
jgi:hypothetical protein